MEKKDFTFVSETDGLEISALKLIPEGDIQGVVQLVHGMCEYKERYLDFMEFLCSQGYACVIHDHRGHGQSVRSADDLGFMYEGGAKGLIEDTHQLTQIAKGEFGSDKPYILLGHSMGSLVVRCYTKKYDDEIDKLIVVGSPSKVPGAKMGLSLAGIGKMFKGERGKWKLIDYIAMDMSYEKPFKSENLPHAWVNSDREAVIRYNNDPLCNYKFTLNGYQALISTTIDTYDPKGWKMAHPDLPVAFFSGHDDPCAANEKAFDASVEFMRSIGYTNVQGKMYQGMRHEVLNEPEHEIVYHDILEFIKA